MLQQHVETIQKIHVCRSHKYSCKNPQIHKYSSDMRYAKIEQQIQRGRENELEEKEKSDEIWQSGEIMNEQMVLVQKKK